MSVINSFVSKSASKHRNRDTYPIHGISFEISQRVAPGPKSINPSLISWLNKPATQIAHRRLKTTKIRPKAVQT